MAEGVIANHGQKYNSWKSVWGTVKNFHWRV